MTRKKKLKREAATYKRYWYQTLNLNRDLEKQVAELRLAQQQDLSSAYDQGAALAISTVQARCEDEIQRLETLLAHERSNRTVTKVTYRPLRLIRTRTTHV